MLKKQIVKIDFALKKVIQQVFIDYLWDNQWWLEHELTSGKLIYIYVSFSLLQEECDRCSVLRKNKIYIPCLTSKVFIPWNKKQLLKEYTDSHVVRKKQISLVLGRIVK